jgi:hypothetical protein
MKTIKEILEPFILDDKNHLYSHNADFLIKQLEDNQREFGKELLEKAADNAETDCEYESHTVDKESITSVLDDFLKENKI